MKILPLRRATSNIVTAVVELLRPLYFYFHTLRYDTNSCIITKRYAYLLGVLRPALLCTITSVGLLSDLLFSIVLM